MLLSRSPQARAPQPGTGAYAAHACANSIIPSLAAALNQRRYRVPSQSQRMRFRCASGALSTWHGGVCWAAWRRRFTAFFGHAFSSCMTQTRSILTSLPSGALIQEQALKVQLYLFDAEFVTRPLSSSPLHSSFCRPPLVVPLSGVSCGPFFRYSAPRPVHATLSPLSPHSKHYV